MASYLSFVWWVSSVFSIAAISPTIAEENLSTITKKIQPSVETEPSNFSISNERLTKLAPIGGKASAESRSGGEDAMPASAGEFFLQGSLSLLRRDYEKALFYFGEAVKRNPQFADGYSRIGFCNALLGRSQEAVEAYRQATLINPGDAEAHGGLGLAYLNLARYKDAIEALKQAISIKSDYAQAYTWLGVAYNALERPNEAIEAYEQAIHAKPDSFLAFYLLGVNYAKLNRCKEAIEAFKQAVHIKPDLAQAHFKLGLGYLVLEDMDSALNEYRILKDLDKTSAARLLGFIEELNSSASTKRSRR